MKHIRDRSELLASHRENIEPIMEACAEAMKLDGAWFGFIKYAWSTEAEPVMSVKLEILGKWDRKRELRVLVVYDRYSTYIPINEVSERFLDRIWRRIQMHVP